MEQQSRRRWPGMEMHLGNNQRPAGLNRSAQEEQGPRVWRASQDQPRKTLAQMLGFDTIHSGLLVFFTNSKAKAGKQDQMHSAKETHLINSMELKSMEGRIDSILSLRTCRI